MTQTPQDFERARNIARSFYDLGWNALPSRMDRKCPMLPSYTDYWNERVPVSIYDDWRTTNIQVITGAKWGLCVVDCDGEASHRVWRDINHAHETTRTSPTWVTRTGGGGWHYWFTLPAWVDQCPSRRLWGLWDTWAGPKHEGDWVKHQEVRLLADQSLVIAPPSVHVTTGQAYEWFDRRGPELMPRPAPAPAWLLDMPAIVNPRTTEFTPPPAVSRPEKAAVRPAGAIVDRDEVIAAIPDKIALARAWGLRVAASKPNAKGWVACHAIGREDRNPSASISVETGVYSECRDGERLSFFDLAARLGVYPDWQTAKADLAARFGVRSR